jgi:hypothetical protein
MSDLMDTVTHTITLTSATHLMPLQHLDISIADTNNNNLNIYINNIGDNIEDELYIYLKEKRVDKKVSLYFYFIRS